MATVAMARNHIKAQLALSRTMLFDGQKQVLDACSSPTFLVFQRTMGSYFYEFTFCTTKMVSPKIMVTRGCFNKALLPWGGGSFKCCANLLRGGGGLGGFSFVWRPMLHLAYLSIWNLVVPFAKLFLGGVFACAEGTYSGWCGGWLELLGV